MEFTQRYAKLFLDYFEGPLQSILENLDRIDTVGIGREVQFGLSSTIRLHGNEHATGKIGDYKFLYTCGQTGDTRTFPVWGWDERILSHHLQMSADSLDSRQINLSLGP